MLKLYRHNVNQICTTRLLYPEKGKPYLDNSKLTISALHQGPLESFAPQNQTPDVSHYFGLLISRVVSALNEDVCDPSSAGWPGRPLLTKDDKENILTTWNRLYAIAPFHTGGFYVPNGTSPEARQHVCNILRQDKTGIYHDLDISRLLVHFIGDKVHIAIGSGWEHAYHAPHWSVARMPAWLVPGTPDPRKLPITRTQQLEMRRTIYNYMRKECPEWVICFTYAESERFFEGLLRSHWSCRDAVEAGIGFLRRRWDSINIELAGLSFPLDKSGKLVFDVDMERYASWVDKNEDNGSQVAESSGAAAARAAATAAAAAIDRTNVADSSGPCIPSTQDIVVPEKTPQPSLPKTEVVQPQVTVPSTPALEEQLAEAISESSPSEIPGPPTSTVPEIFEAPEPTDNSTLSDAESPSCSSPPTPVDPEGPPSSPQKQKERGTAVGGWFGTITKKFSLKRSQGSRTPTLFRHKGSSEPIEI